jgi:transcriptional regulator with XRE-family HTH domain
MENNIRPARTALGMTQQELAKCVGTDHALISKIERGIHDTTGERWLMIAECLGVSVDYLLKREGFNR